MPLPAPNLDDRRFQELVDEAKRLVQRRCPEWTDHNVSDPGVTLIEAFAGMVDQLLYRLNRVPERHYVRFLDLLGVHLLPPADAETDVTFWLSAPLPETLTIPIGTEVATLRTEREEAVSFSVVEPLDVVPCELSRVASTIEPGRIVDYTDTLTARQRFACFDTSPKPGDALLVGLSEPVPRCAVVLRFGCEIEGVGVDPTNPPVVWEAWNGKAWSACEVDRDETGGLNRDGDVVLHVPRDHVASVMDGQRAGWLRCRVVEAAEGQPGYSSSPNITRLSASTIGGTTHVAHSEVVEDEIVGFSDGLPGQRFPLKHRPVVPTGQAVVVQVSGAGGWQDWTCTSSFGESGPADRNFVLDAVAGEIAFGPAVRLADGSLHQYGAVPPKGEAIRVPLYRSGGGRRGNVGRGAISVLKSSIPYVTRIENRRAASGGVDVEDLEAAKIRGPILLRTRNRAVTAEDYEQLAHEAAPDVARVRCIAAGENGNDTGAVRVLVVPAVGEGESGRLRFEELQPPDDTLESIKSYLNERRVIGARVSVEPPSYLGITVVARVRARTGVRPERLQGDALSALYRYFHPVVGGPDGDGWPFGRPLHVGEVYSVLQRLQGTEFVEDARLFPADLYTGKRGEPSQRLDIGANSLVFSYEHQIMVEAS
jgi:predicted phage baseplate assembly protein